MRINALQLQVITQVNSTNVMLSKINQIQRNTHCVLPFIQSSKTNKTNLRCKKAGRWSAFGGEEHWLQRRTGRLLVMLIQINRSRCQCAHNGKMHGVNTDDVYTFLHIKITKTKGERRQESRLSLLLKSFFASESPLIKLNSRYSSWINDSIPWDYGLILAKKKGLKKISYSLSIFTWLSWV